MRGELACAVGADAAGDDEACPTFGPLGIELGQLGEAARFFLEPHVHGTHDGAVGHAHARHIERLQQMGILGVSGCRTGHGPKFGHTRQCPVSGTGVFNPNLIRGPARSAPTCQIDSGWHCG